MVSSKQFPLKFRLGLYLEGVYFPKTRTTFLAGKMSFEVVDRLISDLKLDVEIERDFMDSVESPDS